MSEKLLFAFKVRPKGKMVFEVGEDPNLLEILLAIIKLKKIAFKAMEDLDMLQNIEVNIQTEEDRQMFFNEIIKNLEKNNMWEEDELLK